VIIFMLQRQLAFAAVLAVAALGAQAQTKPELAQRILAAQQSSIENIGSGLAAQTSQQVLEAAGQALQQIPADKRDAVGKGIQADVKQFYDGIEPVLKSAAVKLAPGTVGSLLEEKFNEDELRQILAWIDSPTSRKYQQITGDMQQNLTQKVVAETRGSVEGKLKALEDGLRKRLEDAGGAAAVPSEPKQAAKPPAKKKQSPQ
jgi:uncharacterized protein